jgi:hypothetical protein
VISFSRHLTTSLVFSVYVGKASISPEKIQTNTSRYLNPQAHGISVKSTIKFSRGVQPTLWAHEGVLLALVWGCFGHIAYISHILPYLCWRA